MELIESREQAKQYLARQNIARDKIIMRMYADGETLQAIANMVGPISRERIRQIVKRMGGKPRRIRGRKARS